MSRADSLLNGRLIFLVGARRSGTNWLFRILSAHPQVVGIPPETHLFSHGIRPLAERVHHGASDSNRTGVVWADRDVFLDAVRDLCDAVFSGLADALGGGAQARLLERTPLHATALDLIGDVYPDAAVVHLIRDGRDVARSLIGQDWGPESIAEAAEEWRSTVEAARQERRRIDRYVEVRYEELLADPAGRIREVFRDLGLEATDDVVQAALVEAGVHFNVDPGSTEVREGKWRSELAAGQLETFDEIAGVLLEELGYPASSESEPQPEPGPSRAEGSLARASRIKEAFGRRRRRRGVGDADLQREVLARLDISQQVLDTFFDALARGGLDGIDDVVADTVQVRLSGADGVWEGRGAEAWATLVQAIEADPAFQGRQQRGHLHTALPTSTVVLLLESDDGVMEMRTVAVTVQGRAITEISLYGVTSVPGSP